MHLSAQFKILSPDEEDLIWRSILATLGRVGLRIESGEMIERLIGAGCRALGEERVAFPEDMVLAYLNDPAGPPVAPRAASVGGCAEIYAGKLLDPFTGAFRDWDLDLFTRYVNLARSLPNLSGALMLGCPPRGTDPLQPLYERYYAWKYGLQCGGSIWETRLCPYLLEMVEAYAEASGRPVRECFQGNVYIVSPLRLPRNECEQFLFFHRHGIRVHIGALGSIGGGVPVTLAGALTVHFAEQLAAGIIRNVYFGDKVHGLGTALSPLDMRTCAFRYGRPESGLCNLAGAQLARRYGLPTGGQCGLSDAKAPGYEAGAQKAVSALMTALATGTGYVAAGLLSTDEVFSPVQMVLDNELISCLNRALLGFEATEAEIGLETIEDVGPGGSFLNTDHTAEHFRTELWSPSLWSGETLPMFLGGGAKTDVDAALERVSAVWSEPAAPDPAWRDELDRRLVEIIARAGRERA